MYDILNDEAYENHCPIIDGNCYNEDDNKCNECKDYQEFIKCLEVEKQ